MQLFYVLLYPHFWIADDTPGRLIVITDSKVEALKRLMHEIIQGGPPKKRREYETYTAGEVLTCHLGSTVDDDDVVFRRDPLWGLGSYTDELVDCMRAVDPELLQDSIKALETYASNHDAHFRPRYMN